MDEHHPLAFARADRFHLIDASGTRYLDATASGGVIVHGHGTPAIDDAIREQLTRLAHAPSANQPAGALAAVLAKIAPEGLSRVWYSTSRRAALDAAASIARSATGRSGVVALTGTMAAAVVPGAVECSTIDDVRSAIDDHGAGTVIAEPAVATHRVFAALQPGFLRSLRELCDERGAMLVCDESVVGCGRSGFMWAVTRDGVAPDLLIAGGALTGGTMPLAATMTTERAYEAIDASIPSDPFDGHALACAAALANLDLMERDNFLGEARRKASNLTDALGDLAGHPRVRSAVARGMLAGIEVDDPAAVVARGRVRGVLLGASGSCVVLAPPLAIPDDLLADALRILREIL